MFEINTNASRLISRPIFLLTIQYFIFHLHANSNREGSCKFYFFVLLLIFKEIDLVAAPLTMQTDRERVMDLSHPYFYEATVILLKKPDPNDSKWRTLIDPFHPYVLICIFISLPVSSFFLFFFEKNNPYYRNVEGRNKVRGLHHFSDSFWYMYGALLTQGKFFGSGLSFPNILQKYLSKSPSYNVENT